MLPSRVQGRTDMTRAAIRLLGGFAAYGPDGTPAVLSTRKSQALTAVLALSDNQIASRDRLLGLLWGDRGEQQARHSLNQALTSLRHTFGQDAVIADRETAGLVSAAIEIDAPTFLRQARRDDPAALDA